MNADFIKSAIITNLGHKGNAICDEVGLPILKEWGTDFFADVMEIKKNDTVVIYEVKSSIRDFQTDKKWENYLNHCHLFYFVGDEETIDHIKESTPKWVGLYVIHKCGYMQNIRRSRNTKLSIDSIATRGELYKKIQYRYLKFWGKIKTEKKETE